MLGVLYLVGVISTSGQALLDALDDVKDDALLVAAGVIVAGLALFAVKFVVPWGIGLFTRIARR